MTVPSWYHHERVIRCTAFLRLALGGFLVAILFVVALGLAGNGVLRARMLAAGALLFGNAVPAAFENVSRNALPDAVASGYRALHVERDNDGSEICAMTYLLLSGE